MNHYMSDDYSLTFTVSPTIYAYSPANQYRLASPQLYTILNCLPDCEYLVSTELTKSNNIHFHCYLKYPHDEQYGKLKRRISRLASSCEYLGFFTLKTCYDAPNWLAYMHKNPYIQE